jgi:hypothetical protein
MVLLFHLPEDSHTLRAVRAEVALEPINKLRERQAHYDKLTRGG